MLVQEFGNAVVAGIRDEKFQYIEDILPSFCRRKEIMLRYNDIVTEMCMMINAEKIGYREALLVPFEQDDNWKDVSTWTSLVPKTRQICGDKGIGACVDKDHFTVQVSLSLSLVSVEGYFLYTGGVLFHVGWCIGLTALVFFSHIP